MTKFKSEFLTVLRDRGFIHQMSDADNLDALLAAGPVTGYIGFDCTAKSLHVGNLVGIMMLYWMQQTGHRPIALMGGGTTLVGDPSGKDESRQLLTPAAIAENKAAIKTVFERFLRFGEGPTDALMPDNADWLVELRYVDFLRDYGAHFSVNAMLQRDSVRLRLEREQHLSFLEFNYMVLQAYDFVELNRRFDCRLQMGGSDQWGNIISGVDLGRRTGAETLFALTCPLITTASGAKMGKTAAGAVWLSEALLSAYDYWQFWRNIEDGDVGRFLKLFTTLPSAEADRLAALEGAELNEAKKVLATEATAMVHGRTAAEAATATARQTFEAGGAGDALPTVVVTQAALADGIGLLSACVDAGLAASNGEVRRQIRGGAVRVNDQPITDERAVLSDADLSGAGQIKLSIGRKKHALVKLADG